MSFKCPKCQYENENINSMRIHCQKSHDIPSQEMYDLLVRNGEPRPTCKCGCGKETKWRGLGPGYQDFVVGHHLRVMQNPHVYRTENGFKEAGRKRSEMYKTGEMVAWVKGKTKATDERLAAYGKKGSKTKLANLEQRVQTSERMKTNRLNGTIPTLRGDKHSQWKGGISPFYAYCHGDKRLFELWKYPKLLATNFSCENCGIQNKKGSPVSLHVHHDKIKMNIIMKLCMQRFGYDDKLHKEDFVFKRKVIDAITDFHLENDVSGIVLCEVCHEKEHPKLNFSKGRNKE